MSTSAALEDNPENVDSSMKFSPEHAELIAKQAASILSNEQPREAQIDDLWKFMAYVQAVVLAKKLRNAIGDTVYSGPFKGMRLTPEAMVHNYGPYLAGCYEQELHASLERIMATPYKTILNIGCSFGYYATGLALRMPHVSVHAFDVEESKQSHCRGMVEFNEVSDRVTVAGLFHGGDFSLFSGSTTFVLMDIEGGEKALLDPIAYPALQKMDIVVELHDLLDPTISSTIIERFRPTHDITLIPNRPKLFDFTPFAGNNYIDPFESLLLAWETRDGPTPWAVMMSKN